MFEEFFYVLIATVVGIIFTIAAMPYLLNFCCNKGYFDMPNNRKVHEYAIPRLGGLLFMPAMLVGLAFALIFYAKGLQSVLMLKVSSVLITVGAFLIYTIGILDDLVGMRASHKFIVQLVAALIMPFCGLLINNFYGMFGLYELPFWFSYPFTVFIILLIVNSINLIDGIDGLASSLCLCILAVYAMLYMQIERTYIYSVGIGGLWGGLFVFFCYNMWGKTENHTKTFMGDTGSLFLGYALAFLSIKYATCNPIALPYRNYSLLVSYTLLIVPTFDVLRVALNRLIHRRAIFDADKSHIHHVVMAAGFSMHQTLLIVMALFGYFCLLNFLLYTREISESWIVFLDVASFFLFHFVICQIGMYRCKKKVNIESSVTNP